jgi:hypothetical protein
LEIQLGFSGPTEAPEEGQQGRVGLSQTAESEQSAERKRVKRALFA